MMWIETTGIRELQETLARMQRLGPAAMGRILLAEAEVEMKGMIARTPIDAGDLRGSYRIVGPIFERGEVHVAIVCGGSEAPYAYWVHENLEEFHQVGQAKFMESVVNEAKRHHTGRVGRRWERDELPKLVR